MDAFVLIAGLTESNAEMQLRRAEELTALRDRLRVELVTPIGRCRSHQHLVKEVA